MDSSFTDIEKRFVLAEMIKVSSIDINALVDFVKSNDLQPDLFQMQLPNGRNMNQCIRAAQSMGLVHFPPAHPVKRKSLGDLTEPATKRLAIASTEPHPQSFATYPRNVNIQPRPSPNGYPAPPTPSPTVPAQGGARKRGRPSKADKEAQARANAPSSSIPPILAPAPAPASVIPHQTPLPAPPDYMPSPTYHASPGPVDHKRKRGRTAAAEKLQPRALPENPLEQVEKSPALGNLLSQPIEPPLQQDNNSPAVHEATRKLSGVIPSTQVPIAAMEHIRADNNHTPVNTKA